MPQQIFINLPVSDLPASIAFFTRLGFAFNPQFTDGTATCMIVSDTIFVMLLTHAKFSSFTPRPISDAKAATEVLICLSRDSREAIDGMVRDAVAAGGGLIRATGSRFHVWPRVFRPRRSYLGADLHACSD